MRKSSLSGNHYGLSGGQSKATSMTGSRSEKVNKAQGKVHAKK